MEKNESSRGFSIGSADRVREIGGMDVLKYILCEGVRKIKDIVKGVAQDCRDVIFPKN